ncbi:uncharacterized protein si:dkey-52l18.4 isoform X1 [Pygocentrus nattereri]|uniref:Ig-like domain-containing protein n=1 Tax=Pygocentrus nattereri TaxID=42514 RepID=A0AAR2M6C9_PYGNA|nr:uncharacterized protein si:dkey-52l18.4 isoform X1 [Pygocentrus nattereri]
MPNVLLNRCLTIILTFSCNLQVCVTQCIGTVSATRKTLFVPEGGSVSLQCVVQDCGMNTWTGGWGLIERNNFTPLRPTSRLHLSNYTISANRTCLQVNIQNLNQSDSGTYQCSIIWEGKYTSQGHVTYVNVTTGSYEHITVAELAHRKLSHRLLVCAGASCFPLILGLACCLSSKRLRSPPVPPHFRGTSAARVKPKAEVVYAAVILKSQNQPKRPQAREPIVYSSLNFSTV